MKKSSSSASKKQTKLNIKKDDLKHISGGIRLKDVLNPPAAQENPLDPDEIDRLIQIIKRK
ncbi:hypothetical protein [Legionella clemsonensis]|uniref:Uncharacterized protein n=1 Tax=Legionella clemsonensis TaxID=1867846 RepID=A0A222P3V8_9GAMM|nr:hypothetical protein [Legionella clemsonensis]ASQ46536.1 hypothetical protein clem_09935 [Legionella clemsonensis]